LGWYFRKKKEFVQEHEDEFERFQSLRYISNFEIDIIKLSNSGGDLLSFQLNNATRDDEMLKKFYALVKNIHHSLFFISLSLFFLMWKLQSTTFSVIELQYLSLKLNSSRIKRLRSSRNESERERERKREERGKREKKKDDFKIHNREKKK